MVREATDGAMARKLGQGLCFWLMGSQECNKFSCLFGTHYACNDSPYFVFHYTMPLLY